MPEIVISADTTDTFKRRLDKFWQHQDILYDELAGVGNRSQINADDNTVIALLHCLFFVCTMGIEAYAYAHYTSLLCFALAFNFVFILLFASMLFGGRPLINRKRHTGHGIL